MSDHASVRRWILTACMVLSMLLHGAVFWRFGMQSFRGQDRIYRVLFRPARSPEAKRFRTIAMGRSGHEIRMERLLRHADPEMRAMPGSLPLWGEMRLPEPSFSEERISSLVGAKPSTYVVPSPERIPTDEFGVPKSPRLDPKRDLLRWDDLERAGFKSFVVLDPADRRNIEGFFHIARTSGTEGMDLTRLAENLSSRTRLRVGAEDHLVDLRSPELLKTPMLFMGSPEPIRYDDTGTKREPFGVGVDTLKIVAGVEKQDIEFLGDYLLKGGFLVLPNIELYGQLARYLLEAHPNRFTFFDLPDDHEVFESFFDLSSQELYALFRMENLRKQSPDRSLPSVFKGIGSEGRLVAFAPMEIPVLGVNPDSSVSVLYKPMTELSTNLVVFALSQAGGLGNTAFRESRPERSYQGEPNAALAVLTGGHAVGLDLARVVIFLDEVRLSPGEETEKLNGGSPYDGLLFHRLTGGKYTVRIEYEGKTAEQTVVLRGDHVTTLTTGTTRFLWMTMLWADISGEEESVPAWRARTAHLKIRDVE
ncbi:MAG: hypothetical protein V1800_01780 [Candidatus Latescibacterota bacterium]